MSATDRAALIRRLALRGHRPALQCVLGVRGLHALTDEALELVEKILDQIEHRPEQDEAFELSE